MMEPIVRTQYDTLYAQDGNLRSEAFHVLLKLTDQPVDWAYEVWDDLAARLHHKDGHQRAIAAQILCNLAKSDPETRMVNDFAALLAVTKDDKFVTARHCLQAIWKVGAAGMQQRQLVMDGLAGRFGECLAEKNCTLIRYDIIQGLKQLYESVQDEQVKMKALELIATEQDQKYRKKYASAWKAS